MAWAIFGYRLIKDSTIRDTSEQLSIAIEEAAAAQAQVASLQGIIEQLEADKKFKDKQIIAIESVNASQAEQIKLGLRDNIDKGVVRALLVNIYDAFKKVKAANYIRVDDSFKKATPKQRKENNSDIENALSETDREIETLSLRIAG